MLNPFTVWLQRLRRHLLPSRTIKARRRVCKMSNHFEHLEDRALLTVNLIANESWLIDDIGTTTSSPVIGHSVTPFARWNVFGNTGALNYDVEYSLDGVSVYRGATTFGTGLVDSSWAWYLSAGIATAGTHTVRIKIDPFNSVAESDETDNSYQFSFTTSALPAPIHAYNLNGSLADDRGGAALSSNGGTLNSSTLSFGANQGPAAASLGVTDQYSIEMRVSLDSISGYKKLIDFKDRTSDNGLYFYNGRLAFYSMAPAAGPLISVGSFADVVLTRNATTKVVTGYVNGAQAFSFTDTGSNAVFSSSAGIAHFLRDDLAVAGEVATGQLDLIRVYDVELTASQLQSQLPPSLLDFYGFDGNADDEQGSADGTVHGAILSTGYEGQAYDFNGIDNYIDAAVDINPTTYPRLTIGAWVRADSIRNFGSNNLLMHTVVSQDNAGFDRTLAIDNRGDGNVDWSAFTGAGVLSGPLATTNTWVFLAAVYDDVAQTTTLYVDGQSFIKTGADQGAGHAFINIGRNPSFQSYFDGKIDNLFVFDGALNAQQISDIRFGGSGYLRTLLGTVAAPEIQVLDGTTNIADDLSSVSLGTANLGAAPLTKTFTVKNVGTTALTVNAVSVTGTGFSVVAPNFTAGQTIAPGAQATFTIQLTTGTAGAANGTVSFVTNDSNENPFNFAITGTISAPEIDVFTGVNPVPDNTGTVTFDSSRQGDLGSTKSFTIQNSGSGDLTIGTVVVPTGFTLVTAPATVVAPGTSTTMTVRLNTTTTGTASGTLSFSTNDSDETAYNFTITGYVYANVDLVVTNIQLTPTSAASGDQVLVQWTLKNQGAGAYQGTFSEDLLLSLDAAVGSDQSYGTFTFSGTIGAGQSVIRTQQITLSANLAGPRYVIIRTDSANQVTETLETNNTFIGTPPLQILAPDLTITSVTAPSVVNSGQETELHWIVKNIGTAATPLAGIWRDRVYLSTDDVYDTGDVSLGDVNNPAALAIGESYENQLTVTIPYGTQGIYYLLVRSDYDNRLNENSETNNAGAGNSTNVQWLPPDLRVSEVASQFNAFAGQTTRVTWEVRNQGLGPTRETSWSDRVWLSTDMTLGSGDQLLGTYSHTGSLAAGATYNQTQFVPIPAAVHGLFYVIVETDGLLQVLEGPFEGNNFLADTTQVNVLQTPPPDLEIVTLDAPAQGYATGSVAVNFTVTNAGSTATLNSSWSDRFYLSTDTVIDASDRILSTVSHSGSLAAGASYSITPTLTLPSDTIGTFYILARTDIFGDVFGDNRANNDKADTTPITIAQAPADLSVTTVTAPSAVVIGGSLAVGYTVKNMGPSTTSSSIWSDDVYLSSDAFLDGTDRLLGSYLINGALVTQDSYTVTRNIVLPADISGSYFVFVKTDSSDQVFELFSTNNANRSISPVNIVPPPPDLTVTQVTAPAVSRSGAGLTVTYRVENTGTTVTPNTSWLDRVYLSTNTTLDGSDIPLGVVSHSGSLAPGAGYDGTATFTVRNDLSGPYYVIVATDSASQVFELDEADNVRAASAPTTLQSQPADLIVSAVTGPNAGISGDSLRVDWTIKNNGTGDTIATNWRERVYLSSNNVFDSGDSLMQEFSYTNLDGAGNVVPLAAGASINRTGVVQIPFETVGSQFLFVVVDTADNVYEGLQNGNNVSTGLGVTFSQNLADLQVTALTAPTAAVAGTPFTLTWSTQNLGVGATNNNFWYDSAYLSTDSTLSPDDISLAAVRRSNALAINEQYTTSAQFAIPLGLTGSFYILLKTDSTNLVLEGSAESNNSRASTSTISVTAGPPQTQADLVVTQVSAPSQAISGQRVSLSWTVQNNGDPINSGKWYDSVYLSLDPILDRQQDVYLGYRERTQSLANGANYVLTDSFNIPSRLFGSYYVLIATDSGNTVAEGTTGEQNNLGQSQLPMAVAPVPPADLIVGTITVPANGTPGLSATVSYNVINQGSSPAVGQWYDSLYISADDVWDINDAFFGRYLHSGQVAANGSYTGNLTAPLPEVLPGDYHIIVRSDIRNQIAEVNENNNIGGSLNSVVIDVEALIPGLTATGTLLPASVDYFKVVVPEGQTLKITFDPQTTSPSELYVKFSDMPSRSSFDFADATSLPGSRTVTVPTTVAGTYYVSIRSRSTSSDTFSLRADLVPFGISSLSRTIVGNSGEATLQIKGARFSPATSFSLLNSAGVEVVQAINTDERPVLDASTAYAMFDLAGIDPGAYFVRAIDGDLVSNLLPLTVTTGTGRVDATLTAPTRSLTDRLVRLQLDYGNSGDNDVLAPLIIVRSLNGNLLWTDIDGESEGQSQLALLGTADQGPSGTLMPGASGQIVIYSRATTSVADIDVEIIDPSNEPFEWASLYALSPGDSVWYDAVDAARAQLGESLGSVITGLARTATLAGQGNTAVDLRAFLAFRLFSDGAYLQSTENAPLRTVQHFASNSSLFAAASAGFNASADVTLTSATGTINPAARTIVITHGWNNSGSEAWVTQLATAIKNAEPGVNVLVADWGKGANTLLPNSAAGNINAAGKALATLLRNDHIDPKTLDFVGHSFGTYVSNVAAGELGGARNLYALDPANHGGLSLLNPTDTEFSKNFEYSVAYHSGDFAGTSVTTATEDFVLDGGIGWYHPKDQHSYAHEFFTQQVISGGEFGIDRLEPTTHTRRGYEGEITVDSNGNVTLDTGVSRWTAPLNTLWEVIDAFDEKLSKYWKHLKILIRTVASLDPNDIVGPIGFGPENWTVAQQPLNYTIRFENDPVLATAPAQSVTITQTLDSDLDPRSFRLGDFGFGDTLIHVPANQSFFTTRIDLSATQGIYVDVFAGVDVSTGSVFWTFTSIDPATGDLPEDATKGFLPLNLIDPEGDGFVSYTVRAKSGVTTGTRIDAQARIVFDINEPIDTPAIFNTLDAVAPTSAVVAVPSQPNNVDGRFLVSWSGRDDDNGSSLAEYDVYVSTDGGPFALWLSRTTATASPFAAPVGHQYAFYSVARDNAGNVEALPIVSDTLAVIGNQPPVVTPQTFTVPENAANGTVVGTVSATDPEGQTWLYSIVGGNGAFAINASTGQITVADGTQLNFEGQSVIALTVKATDNGFPPQAGTATMTIQLTDVNEAPTVVAASMTVPEDSANGVLVGTVTANDPDAGQSRTFAILSGDPTGVFTINPSTGAITVADHTQFNRVLKSVYTLTVKATDSGAPALSGTGIVTVTLGRVNKAPSVTAAVFSVAENSNNGTVVGNVTASDPDLDQTRSFAITAGNANGAFAINATTGQITVADSSRLNFETTPTFALTVQVTDNGTPPLTASATISISLTNVNEAPAVVPATMILAENSANGTVVGTVGVTDPDVGQPHTFAITGGNAGGGFAINQTTGQITVADFSRLNYELNPTFTLTVQTTDNGSPALSASGTIIISLTDVNEVPVVQPVTLFAAENSPNGTFVGTASVTDPEVVQTHTFAITGGNTNGAFDINPDTGEITVANSTALNFQTTPSFSLTVRATDNGNPVLSATGTVIVTLTDTNEPPVVNSATFQLAENSANSTPVGTVTASDPDNGQTRTFAIISGNSSGAFAINPATGLITVADGSQLNYELTPAFSLTIRATDNGLPPLSANGTITISLTNVNEAPAVVPATFSVAENRTSGAIVGTVATTDPEINQSHTFAIVAGNTNGTFAIDPATGQITVADPTMLNYEGTPAYSLTVRATDNGSPALSATGTINISVLDANEPPVMNPASFTLAENSATGTVVGTVTASDPDAGQSRTFLIIAGNSGGAFAINPSTGLITVFNGSLLDFETTPTIPLTIRVTDNGQPALFSSATASIQLTNVNEPPKVRNTTLTLDENSPSGAVAGTVIADDPEQGSVTYAIVAGNALGAFSIDASSGVISVADSHWLDYETTPNFNLSVQATDNGTPSFSNTGTVAIRLRDVNESPQMADATFSVPEHSSNGFLLGDLSASDPDLGQSKTFSITSGNGAGIFAINSSTGRITIVNGAALDFETSPTLSLTIQVTDDGNPSLSQSATVTVHVQDANDSPIFSGPGSFVVAENTPAGSTVGTIVASDPDTITPNNQLTYSIASGNTDNAFGIDPSTGRLFVSNPLVLNYEAQHSLVLQIVATDGGTIPLTAAQVVTITLDDVNEPPVVSGPLSVTLNENAPASTAVVTVQATDPDVQNTLAYSITDGNSLGAFAINPDSGVVTVANPAPLDFETTPTFTLTIQVADNAGEIATNTLTIHLNDLGEVPLLVAGSNGVTWTKNQAPVTVWPQLTIASSGSLAGNTLTIMMQAVGKKKTVDLYRFPAVNLIGSSSGAVFANGGLVLQVQLGQQVSLSDLQSFLRGLTFSTKGAGLNVASRQVQVTLENESGHSTVFQTIHVVKKPPRLPSRRIDALNR